MPRPIDPEKHRARRLVIIDAALTCFARSGYDGAKVADICREAAIGSGTFFHYFPTKLGVLLGVLELGTAETAEFFEGLHAADGTAAVLAYVAHESESLRDERAPGFIRAVGAVATEHRVANELAANEELIRGRLRPWVEQGQRDGSIRADLEPERVIAWVRALVDGFASHMADGHFGSIDAECDVLLDTIRRFLRP